jgi:hypothetical protein
MAKLNIDFILLDESVVMYGFRALMSGAQLEGFQKNPVMLFMHSRALSNGCEPVEDDAILPIGKWYDIRIDGGRLLAKPDFDDDDEFAQRIQKKVENGYLNGASVWIDPIAISDDANLQLPGQYGPTVTQWNVFEASIVDIPNCRNALAIRNADGKLMKLFATAQDKEVIAYLHSLHPKNSNSDMDKKLLAVKLGLTETATDEQIAQKLTAVLNAAQPNMVLASENKELKDQLVAMQTAQEKAKVESLVDGAIAAGKLTAPDRPRYIKLATADYDTTSELIGNMKPYKSFELMLKEVKEDNALEADQLMKLSGRQLYLDGKLERLKEIHPEGFKLKYKEAFGLDFKG